MTLPPSPWFILTQGDGVAVSFFIVIIDKDLRCLVVTANLFGHFYKIFFPTISRLWDSFVSIDEGNLCAG